MRKRFGTRLCTVTNDFPLPGTCACSRLLQTRDLGVWTVSMEDKVSKEAKRPGRGPPQDYHVNTTSDDYRLMHQTIQSMRQCEAAAGGKKDNEFVAILFEWQARLSLHDLS